MDPQWCTWNWRQNSTKRFDSLGVRNSKSRYSHLKVTDGNCFHFTPLPSCSTPPISHQVSRAFQLPPQLCSLSQYCLLPHEKPYSFLLPQQPCSKHPPANIMVIRLWHSAITGKFNTKGIHIDRKLQGKWTPGIAGSGGLDSVFRNLSPLLSNSFEVLTSF